MVLLEPDAVEAENALDGCRRLPNRRRCETQEIAVGNLHVTATVGFGPDGRPAEVVMTGGKCGTDLSAILADAAVAISVALQSGLRAAELGKSVGRLPRDPSTGNGYTAGVTNCRCA